MQTDFLIVGSGIAGLTYALKMANAFPEKNNHFNQGQSRRWKHQICTGGVAGVWDFGEDSFDKHIEDTLISGDGLSNKNIVDIVVKEGVERIKELIAIGANFDKDEKGEYKLGREGAQRKPYSSL